MKISTQQVTSYITKDQSEIRELLHPNNQSARNQSLAEATVYPQQTTTPHYHLQTEEIYFILEGTGEMQLDGKSFAVKVNDSVLIPAGQVHFIKNVSDSVLRFLCCCAPAYQHEDTYIVQQD